MRDSKKYLDDMVENLAESPGMCSDGPGSAPIEIPREEPYSYRGSKKERKERMGFGGGREGGLVRFHPAAWDPPARGMGGRSAEPPRTVREAC
jgi:hypothetical protein